MKVYESREKFIADFCCVKCHGRVWPAEAQPSCVGESYPVCSECHAYHNNSGALVELPDPCAPTPERTGEKA